MVRRPFTEREGGEREREGVREREKEKGRERKRGGERESFSQNLNTFRL